MVASRYLYISRPRANHMEPKKPSLISNIIAAIGFFFIVLLLIWGLMNIARWAPSLFGGIGSWFGAGKTLSITLDPPTVQSGNPMLISWKHNASNGTYAFVYECRTDVTVEVPNTTNTTTQLPCATAYVVAADGPQAIRITPRTTLPSIAVPFTVTYRDDNGVAGATAADAFTITNPTPIATTTPPVISRPTTTPSTSTPRIPDLSVRLLDLGIMRNGTYMQASNIGTTDIAAVRFEIKNTGTAPTGTWRFRAILPSNPTYTYDSALQQSLAPGDRIEYTLQFSNVNPNGGLIQIAVDPRNAVKESSELNNVLSYQMTMYR